MIGTSLTLEERDMHQSNLFSSHISTISFISYIIILNYFYYSSYILQQSQHTNTTPQYNTTQYNTIQHNTTQQFNTTQRRTGNTIPIPKTNRGGHTRNTNRTNPRLGPHILLPIRNRSSTILRWNHRHTSIRMVRQLAKFRSIEEGYP